MFLPTSEIDGFGGGVAPWGAGPTGLSPWAAGPGPAALGHHGCPPGCHVVYGPVANVCHSVVPQVNLIPTTSVTPIPNPVSPALGYGAPVPVGGPVSPLGAPPGVPYGPVAGAVSPLGPGGCPPGCYPAGGASPVSFYGHGYGPFGPISGGGTGWAPGIYGSDVTMMGYW